MRPVRPRSRPYARFPSCGQLYLRDLPTVRVPSLDSPRAPGPDPRPGSRLPLLVAACGGGEEKNTAPDTVVGSLPAETGGATTGGGGTAGDAAAGKAVFTENCGSCHVLADAGTTGTVGPNLDDGSRTRQVDAQVTNGGGAMPAFEGTLSEQQIADVAAYVAENAGS